MTDVRLGQPGGAAPLGADGRIPAHYLPVVVPSEAPDVPTMAQLAMLGTRPSIIFVQGFHTPGDGGGGAFYWAAGSTASPLAGMVVSPMFGPEGRYVRLVQNARLEARWFGAKGDGENNDTPALQAFLDVLADGGSGNWEGNWLVDEGVLRLHPTRPVILPHQYWKHHRAPHIEGHAVFTGRGTGTGPFLTIENPHQRSTNGDFYGPGAIGSMTFIDKTRSTLLTRHGLAIQGLYAWHFGAITGYGLGGSVVYLARTTLGGNTDPYSSQLCYFDSVNGNFCNGYALDAEWGTECGNYFGWVGSGGMPARGIETGNGSMRNSGQGTEVHSLSAGGCQGWAVTYGDRRGGNRQIGTSFEIGACQYGLWVVSNEQFQISGRIETGPALNGDPWWPLTFIKIGGIGRSVLDGKIDFIVRIDPGTTLEKLGTLIDFSNEPNIRNLEINLDIQDNAEIGLFKSSMLAYPISTFLKNINPLAAISVKFCGISVFNQTCTTAARVRFNSGSGSLPSSGFGTLASKLSATWSVLNQADFFGIVDERNCWFNVVAQGRYRVHCHLNLPVGNAAGKISPGSLIQYALIDDDGSGNPAAYRTLDEGAALAVEANGVHRISMDAVAATLVAGHRLWISLQVAGQNGRCTLTHQLDMNGANIFEMALLPPD